MSLTLILITKLSRVEPDVARRALSTARAQDEIEAPKPEEFSRGAGAMAYAMALFITRRPAHFYLGLTGLIVFAVYIVSRLASALMEWGIHAYGR